MRQMFESGHSKFGDIPRKIKALQDTLYSLKNGTPTQDCWLSIHTKDKALDEFLKQEELWWSQTAKTHWLKFGDLNTKFFHQKATQR
jgi:hypothetical protein